MDEKTWLEKRREALEPKPSEPLVVMATIEAQAEAAAPEGVASLEPAAVTVDDGVASVDINGLGEVAVELGVEE